MTDNDFIKHSLDYNLFYLRIMAEHLVLLVSAVPKINEDLIDEGKYIYQNFTEHIKKGLDLELSEGIEINDDTVTEFTLKAEQKTAALTGFDIDTSITVMENNFSKYVRTTPTNLVDTLKAFNERSIALTTVIITYKTKLLDLFTTCKIAMHVYPLLIDHTRREADTFIHILTKLQNRDNPIDTVEEALGKELFWNDIMGEHAMFIRGLLDPTEELLYNIANETLTKYEELNRKINAIDFNEFTNESLNLTQGLQKFKVESTEGLLKCNILSMIPVLMADHVLREANHYLRVLDMVKGL